MWLDIENANTPLVPCAMFELLIISSQIYKRIDRPHAHSPIALSEYSIITFIPPIDATFDTQFASVIFVASLMHEFENENEMNHLKTAG